jgi:hypothetical protein
MQIKIAAKQKRIQEQVAATQKMEQELRTL